MSDGRCGDRALQALCEHLRVKKPVELEPDATSAEMTWALLGLGRFVRRHDCLPRLTERATGILKTDRHYTFVGPGDPWPHPITGTTRFWEVR